MKILTIIVTMSGLLALSACGSGGNSPTKFTKSKRGTGDQAAIQKPAASEAKSIIQKVNAQSDQFTNVNADEFAKVKKSVNHETVPAREHITEGIYNLFSVTTIIEKENLINVLFENSTSDLSQTKNKIFTKASSSVDLEDGVVETIESEIFESLTVDNNGSINFASNKKIKILSSVLIADKNVLSQETSIEELESADSSDSKSKLVEFFNKNINQIGDYNFSGQITSDDSNISTTLNVYIVKVDHSEFDVVMTFGSTLTDNDTKKQFVLKYKNPNSKARATDTKIPGRMRNQPTAKTSML